jgi:hypothetical protein
MVRLVLLIADCRWTPSSANQPSKTGNTIKQKGRHNCRRLSGSMISLLLSVPQQQVTAMKLSIVAVATVFALSSPALAQNGSSGGLNGGTLGLSQPGVNAGVPYPNPAAADPTPEATDEPAPAATDRTAPVASSSVKQQGAAPPKHRKDSAMSASRKKPPAQSAQAAAKPAPPSPGASSPR